MLELKFFGVPGHMVDLPESLRSPSNFKKLIGLEFKQGEGWVPTTEPDRVVLNGHYAHQDKQFLRSACLNGALKPADEKTAKELRIFKKLEEKEDKKGKAKL